MVQDLSRTSGSFRDVVIVGGLRTAFAKSDTVLGTFTAVDLGRYVVAEVMERFDLKGPEVDSVVVGNIAQPIDAPNVARVIALRAGLPRETPAHTVNRNCGSGMEAVMDAARLIATGEARVVIAGGVESMSQIPLCYPESYRRILFRSQRAKGLGKRVAALSAVRPRHFRPIVALERGLTDPVAELNMGQTAEVLAKEFGIGRPEQDEFALRSHQRAVRAQQSGRFDVEIASIFVPPRFSTVIKRDNGPRENQSIEALGKLRPLFDREFGTVTAGNACPITDGAAALVLADRATADARGWKPMGRIRSHAVRGIEPERMGLGPVLAGDAALQRAGMRLSDLDLLEINEAFAAQVLACEKAFASPAFAETYLGRSTPTGTLPMDRLNVNGGAIALGHPVGVSGARLVLTLLHEMQARNVGTGLAALCIGGGQGSAMIVERP
jgi:acetyl-CoA C-acetyltransferase/acetyl-CoA acyltransferase